MSPHPTEASWGKLFCQAAKGPDKKTLLHPREKCTRTLCNSTTTIYLYDDDNQRVSNLSRERLDTNSYFPEQDFRNMSALEQKLATALASREDRGIRCRLPTASLSLLPSTPGITSGPTSDISFGAPSRYPPPSQQPSPQSQHQVPSPSPPPRSHSHILSYTSESMRSTSRFLIKRLPLLLHLPAPAHPHPHSANHIISDPQLRRLASPSLQPSTRSARGPPSKDVPRARSPLLQLGLRRQRGLLRVHTATGQRAPLRCSHPRFRPR